MIAELYERMPSEIVDPRYELPEYIRDEIDLMYRSKHRKRILDIMEGKLTIDGKRVLAEDPYPAPQNMEFLKNSKFGQKIAREAGWIR